MPKEAQRLRFRLPEGWDAQTVRRIESQLKVAYQNHDYDPAEIWRELFPDIKIVGISPVDDLADETDRVDKPILDHSEHADPDEPEPVTVHSDEIQAWLQLPMTDQWEYLIAHPHIAIAPVGQALVAEAQRSLQEIAGDSDHPDFGIHLGRLVAGMLLTRAAETDVAKAIVEDQVLLELGTWLFGSALNIEMIEVCYQLLVRIVVDGGGSNRQRMLNCLALVSQRLIESPIDGAQLIAAAVVLAIGGDGDDEAWLRNALCRTNAVDTRALVETSTPTRHRALTTVDWWLPVDRLSYLAALAEWWSSSPTSRHELEQAIALIERVQSESEAKLDVAEFCLLFDVIPETAEELLSNTLDWVTQGDPDGARTLCLRAAAVRNPLYWMNRRYALIADDLGPDHPETLGFLNVLGRALHEIGDFGQARVLFEACYQRSAEFLGPDHPEALTALGNLASVLHDVGELDQARVLYQACCQRRTELLGPDHPATLTSVNNLASLLSELRELDHARTLYEGCYKRRLEILGPSHHETIGTLINLAGVSRSAGEFGQARILSEDCYRQCVDLFGPTHPTTLAALSSLANTLYAVGELEQAYELQQSCYQGLVESRGANHPETLISLNNLARMSESVGELEQAYRMYEACYRRMVESRGANHQYTLGTVNNLAIYLHGVGELDQAIELHEYCYRRSLEVLGERHVLTLSSQMGLALTLMEAGDMDRARSLFGNCYQLHNDLLGANHPQTLASLNNLAQILDGVGEVEQARALWEESYKRRSESLGANHPATLTALSILADSLTDLGEMERAGDIYEDCYRRRSELLGANHPDTLISLSNLAKFRRSVGEPDQALHAFAQCFSAAVSSLGVHHPTTWGSFVGLRQGGIGDGVTSTNASFVFGTVAGVIAQSLQATAESATWLPNLPQQLADAVLASGPTQETLAQLIEQLETIRASRFGELQRRHRRLLDDLRANDRSLADRLSKASSVVDQLERFVRRNPDRFDDLQHARQKLAEVQALVSERLPGFDDTTSVGDLTDALGPDEALIYVVGPGRFFDGCRTITVTRDRPLQYHQAAARSLGRTKAAVWHALFHTMTSLPGLALDRQEDLAGEILAPALAELPENISRLFIVPVGELALLPFHIARIDNETIADRFAVGYLLLGSQLVERAEPSSHDGGSRAATMAIAGRFEDLTFPQGEVEGIARTRGFSIIDGSQIDRSAMRSVFAESSAAHAAVHGVADPFGETTRLIVSSVADDSSWFPVGSAEEIHYRRRDELFLAACSARTPQLEAIDEVYGFPNAFLAAGFRAVITAGWPVDDNAAGFTSLRYHERRSDGREPVDALAEAQRWLKRSTINELSAYLTEQIVANRDAGLPTQGLERAREQFLEDMRDIPESVCPFDDPLYWGAFTITGA